MLEKPWTAFNTAVKKEINIKHEQECIPVAVWGVFNRHPPPWEQAPLGQVPPWEQTRPTPQDQAPPPGADTPQEQTPPDQAPPQEQTPLGADPPFCKVCWDSTPPCCKACWDTTCNACWDSTAPVDRILDTRFWKYYLAPNFVCGR